MILVCLVDVGRQPEMAFSNLVVADDFSRFLGVIFAVAAALSYFTPATAFFATAVKAVAFAALLRIRFMAIGIVSTK